MDEIQQHPIFNGVKTYCESSLGIFPSCERLESSVNLKKGIKRKGNV